MSNIFGRAWRLRERETSSDKSSASTTGDIFAEDITSSTSDLFAATHDDITTKMTTLSVDNSKEAQKRRPRLLEYPPEIRNLIYAYAVSEPGKIIVKSRRQNCSNPPLTQVSRQLRNEVTPIFFESNTFHFSPTDIKGINIWTPFREPSRLSFLALDRETSIMYFHTITSYLLQPTRLLHEDELLDVQDEYPPAHSPSRELAGGTVLWGTKERIIESLAENPRPHPFLRIDHLEGFSTERKEKLQEGERRGATEV